MKIDTQISYQPHEFANDAEQIQAAKLTDLQVMNIQNLILECVNEKLNMVPTPQDPQTYFLQQEYLRGQITILQYLISCSNNV